MKDWIQALEPRRLLSASPYAGPLQVVPDLSPAEQTTYVGAALTATVATLTGVAGAEQLRPRQLPKAIIRWGDGSGSQALTVVASGTSSIEAISGEGHVYKHPGTFVLRTTFYYRGRTLGTVAQSISVAQNTVGGITIHVRARRPFTTVIGTFVPNAATPPTEVLLAFWGDGTLSSVTIQSTSSDTDEVIGSHSYAHRGTYRISIGTVLEPDAPTRYSFKGIFSTAVVGQRE